MPDMHFEETCPCGSTMKVSGYESQVKPQIATWHSVHNKHSAAISKAIAAAKEKASTPLWYWGPFGSTTTTVTIPQDPNIFTTNANEIQSEQK